MVILIFPVFAPVGTVAVTCAREFTVKAALTPPKVTEVAPVSPVPVIVTWLPTGPLPGLKLSMAGNALNFCLLNSVPEGVVTVTALVVTEAGTTAVMYVSLSTVKVAEPEPNITLVAPVRPSPRSSTVWLAAPAGKPTSETKGLPRKLPRTRRVDPFSWS